MKEPIFKEGRDRDDPRLWRINELPQRFGEPELPHYRTAALLH